MSTSTQAPAQEQLHTCPDCGTRNFTKRGLSSHRGGTNCQRVQAEKKADEGADAPATHLAVLTTFAWKRGAAPIIYSYNLEEQLGALNSPSAVWIGIITAKNFDHATSQAARMLKEGGGIITGFGKDAGFEFAAKPAVKTLTLESLETLPPVKRAAKPGAPMALAEIEDHIIQLDAQINDRTRAYHNEVIYDIVAKGLMLLKGREIHLRQGQKALVETVSTSGKQPTPKALAKAEEKGEQGFIAWLEKTFPEQSARTARNYMNAARNACLTSDHGLADVAALRQTGALNEKKPTDLYRLEDSLKDKPAELPEPKIDLVGDTDAALFEILDDALQLRDDHDVEPYEAVTTRVQAFLEAWTGCKWSMVDDANDSAQHGDVGRVSSRATKPAKKGAKRK